MTINPQVASARERETAMYKFIEKALDQKDFQISSASSDASFRSYWRVQSSTQFYVVMNAPPEKEDCGAWLDIAKRLRSHGLNAPLIYAQDLTQGFILMSDLGSQSYLQALQPSRVNDLYRDAIKTILQMQTRVDSADLPHYDSIRLRAELDLFPTWFVERHLGEKLDELQTRTMTRTFQTLIDSALAQPQVFVHRDYHSRNLMLVEQNNPGIIDFQDAVRGPFTYDLVSLLRDCYIEWPDDLVQIWVDEFYRDSSFVREHLISPAQFQRWFDLMGLQRHIKVLGIFCRLWYRDNKSNYLDDLPLVLRYTQKVAMRYPETRDFGLLLERLTQHVRITEPNA